MRIETVLSPQLFSHVDDVEEKVVVVIDVLRATSTISTIINNGANAVIPVMDVDDAKEFKEQGYLVGGERGGETIPGFDFGNSPLQYHPELVNGRDVVLTTTNGTKCIEMSSEAHTVITGSFLNLSAVVRFIKHADRDVVLFCAGWKDLVNLEDSLFAGAVASQLDGEKNDATLLAIDGYECARNDLFKALKNSNHFQRLADKGVIKDIEYCCKSDLHDVVPTLIGGRLVNGI